MLNQAIEATKARIEQLQQELETQHNLLARQESKAEMFRIMQEQLLILGQELVDEELFTVEEVNNTLIGELPPTEPTEPIAVTQPVIKPVLVKPKGELHAKLVAKKEELTEVLDKVDKGLINKREGIQIIGENLKFLEDTLGQTLSGAKSGQG